jgi:CelD/BcsL family acetyltransferase involved in cellulose biosynthesis
VLATHPVAGEETAPIRTKRTSPAGRYEVLLDQRESDIARRLAGVGAVAVTPFQGEGFLRAWYATIGRTIGEPLLVTAIERGSGELAAMLPLVKRTDGRLRVITFADADVSDSNAPMLGVAAPANTADASALWDAIRTTLSDADVVRLRKMPAMIEGRANPLALLPFVQRSPLSSNIVLIERSFDDYLATLRGMLRKQLRKHWRLFGQHDGAAFRRIDDPDEAVRVLAILERRQGERLRAQGEPYRLDEPAYSAFYRAITAEGVADGSVILTALTHRDEVVAALLGLARGDTYVMVRICADAERWANCSPGKLIIVKTMESLHAEGFRVFDFSVGDYDYKRRLGARGGSLFELTAALTPRGLPLYAYDKAKHVARRYPAIRALARRLAQRKRAAAAGSDHD